MVRIVSPITKLDEAKPLIEAGADELYCGVLTEEENRDLTNICCLNRRPSSFSNLRNFNELSCLVKIAKDSGVKVSLTLNEFYTKQQFDNVKQQIEKAVGLGVDAIIAVDLGVIEELRQYRDKIKLHIGVGGTTFNHNTVQFYRNLGARRIILPRHLSLTEISQIRSMTGGGEPDLECLILNERCHNIDGLCGFEHGVFSYKKTQAIVSKYAQTLKKIYRFLPKWLVNFVHVYGMEKELACCFNYKIREKRGRDVFPEKTRPRLEDFFDADSFLNACGACSLGELENAGVKFVKIVGRVFFKDKVNDVKFIRHCLGLLENGSLSPGEYNNLAMKAYRKYFNKRCKRSYCYYP
ncbi:MAG: U32 family peptidase [Candidatus Omnitrophica bacterium]|nr:U32 family peptidase [Candidatus Omnitrophota bacterium]MDD5501499.1 U32 family peptidase [Candidatus Omnitrophota bacterium]